MQWRHSTSPKRNKFKQTPYTSRKMMAIIFWDEKCVFLVDLWNVGKQLQLTCSYCKMLNKLRRAIQNQRRRKLSSGVILLHDNTPLPKPRRKFKVFVVNFLTIHSTLYCLNLAPSDYFLFLHFKQWLDE